MSTATRSNRLAEASSLYLRQHASNPVHWWPWCDQALAQARLEQKPILLSIGYSACHWCHVMAHESFADPNTADLMNQLFVSIKVDREERPDLDRIYQTAHQIMTGRPGGWPLTAFLTPDDHHPFFVGTYFPPERRHGLPAFREVLLAVERGFREQSSAIAEQKQQLLSALRGLEPEPRDAPTDAGPLEAARRQLAASFDRDRGGFGRAPKFPHPTNLSFLLRHYAITAAGDAPDEEALRMAAFTLERMICGGVNDQIGGGFFRYSVDDDWMIPHFEKMLYDNGPLLGLCADLWQITGDDRFRKAAGATAGWMIDEMESANGGFFSSLDADTGGEEGQFYLWTPEEIAALLGETEFALVSAVYGLDRPANFDSRWHLHQYQTPEVAAAGLAGSSAVDPSQAQALLTSADAKLRAARGWRQRPGRDEKILTSWNALAIAALARSARATGSEDQLAAAERALGFIRRTLWQDGRLLAKAADDQGSLSAYLDDHALLLAALLELLQSRWRSEDLDLATQIADVLLERFYDDDHGGFFLTPSDHERLLHRPKPLADEAMPSGNGVAAFNLQRLGYLLGDQRYLEAARKTLAFAAAAMDAVPYAHASLLAALDEHLDPPEILIIRAESEPLRQWQRQAQASFAPRRLVFAIPNAATELPPALAVKEAAAHPRAYRCRGPVCEAPIDSVTGL